MNVKQFKRRWLNHCVEPELFYMPVNKKEKEEEFVFEVENVEEISWYSWCNYSLYGTSISHTISSNYKNHPQYQYIPKDNNVLYHFSFNTISDDDVESQQNQIYLYQTRLFERPKDENDNDITKISHPELFTDWSIHNLRENLFSENLMISPDDKVTINWGDGSSDTFYYTDERFLWDKVEINGETYRVFRGYGNNLMQHTYTKKGTYIIKITGFLPTISLPAGTTRIINWGKIGLRYFPTFNLCTTTFRELGIINNLDNMISLNGQTLGNCPNVNYNAESFKFCNNLKSLVFAQYVINLERLDAPISGLLSNCPYLISSKYIFFSIPSQSLSLLGGTVIRSLGDDILRNCPELRIVDSLFYRVYTTNINYQIKIQIGDNFLRNCPCIWNSYRIFCCNGYSREYNAEQIGYNSYRALYSNKVDIQKIGKYCLAECSGLTKVEETFSYINIEEIGEGLFYGNQNIRYAYHLFYCCNNLKKVPDKLFCYLKSNQDYVEDYFTLYSLIYRDDITSNSISVFSMGDFESIPKTEIGKDMFNESFLNSGKIIISTQPFVYPINHLVRVVDENGGQSPDACGDYPATISSSLYSGELPNLWDYEDNVGQVLIKSERVGNTYIYDYLFVSYNQLFSFDFPEEYLLTQPARGLRRSDGYFGREKGMFGIFGSYDSFVHWSNYDSIPKQTKYQYYGESLTDISAVKEISNISERISCTYWLTPLMFDDINLNLYIWLYDHYFMINNNLTNLKGAIEYAVSNNLDIEDFILNCELYPSLTRNSTAYNRCLINGKKPIVTSNEDVYPLVSNIETMEFVSTNIGDDGNWLIDTETLDFKLNSCITHYTTPVDTYNMGRMRCGNYPIISGKTFGFAVDPYHVNYYEFDVCKTIKKTATIDYTPVLDNIKEQLINSECSVDIYKVVNDSGWAVNTVIQTINALTGGNTTQNKDGKFSYGVGVYHDANPGNSVFSLSVVPIDGFYGDYKLNNNEGTYSSSLTCQWSYYRFGGLGTRTDIQGSEYYQEIYTNGRETLTESDINRIYLYKTIEEKMSEFYGTIVSSVCPHYKKFDFNTKSSFTGTLDYYSDVSGVYIRSTEAKSEANYSFSTIIEIEPKAKYASTDYGVYYIAK